MSEYKAKVMAEWPNLKPEWAEKYARFLERELSQVTVAAQQPLQARVTELEAELGKASSALDYERLRCDAYAAKNAALTEEVQAKTAVAEQAARIAEGIPTEDIEGVLQPGRLPRVQYLGALSRVSQWLDAVQATMEANGMPFVELGNPEAKGQVEIDGESDGAVDAEQPIVGELETVPDPAPEATLESGDN